MHLKLTALGRARAYFGRAPPGGAQSGGAQSGGAQSGAPLGSLSGLSQSTSQCPPAHGTLRALALTTAADIGGSCLLLYLLVQPARAPLAFGGWALGRAITLSQEVHLEYLDD